MSKSVSNLVSARLIPYNIARVRSYNASVDGSVCSSGRSHIPHGAISVCTWRCELRHMHFSGLD